ncbi:acyl-CoA synthetase [Aliidongia dinghuensis]|uniref:Acyl-CoA synthetase n=1 Tax=Aliidongia dinghuensis TaxID=1867774 RepID=A0A8J2Z1V6_9PROT|nr:fatty acyl-AMP ligase [Aliidongia dinghuensis]GGF47411.1 acyl-CoA synthetase [Aliidongia dinghuensis]
MTEPTASHHPELPTRYADFGSIAEALDYAAKGPTGLNFYSGKGTLIEALPYRALREQAIDLARRLLGAGLEPGDRVGLVAESDGDFVRAFFACQYAGLVPAPLPLPAAFGGKDGYIAHLKRMLQSARVSAAFGPAMLEAWLEEVVADLDLKAAGTLRALDGSPPVAGELPAQDPDGLSYLQFSSGSTRFPLGVAVTQRAFMANAQGMGRDGLAIGDGDRAITWLPFYHDMGLVGFLLTPIACQMTVDVISTRDFARRPLLWLNLISRNRATVSYSPSFGYELCVRRSETASIDGIDLSSWRSAGIGGDMIRPNVLTRFAERFGPHGFKAGAFVPSYGMAEATLALSFMPAGEGARHDVIDSAILEAEHRAAPARDTRRRTRTFVLCGRMLPDHDIEIRDEAGRLLPDRRVGRIFVRGPSLMSGYFDAPEETARVMSDDGWLDTGDLGYLVDGQIVITGRAKDLIIVNGRNLWPQDLEWAVEAELALLRSGDVAVFSVDGETDEEVVALVQCRSSEPAMRDALATEVANVLRGRHGLDSKIVLVPPHSLPQTSSGKLSRSRARTMYLAGEFSRVAVPADAGAE